MTHSVDADHELRRTAEFVEAVSSYARSRLTLFWFPMACFGIVSLGAAVTAVVTDPDALGLYWMVFGTLAGIATAVFYRRSELRVGLTRKTWPYLAAAGFLGVGVFGAPLVTDDPAWLISVWTGLGYGAFAWIERNVAVAGAATAFVLLGLLCLIVDVNNEIAWVSAVTGVVLLGGAAVLSPRRAFS